jgi:hypothetical protein
VVTTRATMCDIKNPAFFPPSVFIGLYVHMIVTINRDCFPQQRCAIGRSYGSTLCYLWCITNSWCARYEEITAFLPRKPGFNPWPFGVGFVLDTVTLRQIFLLVLWFTPIIIILLMFHTHLHLNAVPTRRRSGRSIGISLKQPPFGYRVQWTEEYFHALLSRQSL